MPQRLEAIVHPGDRGRSNLPAVAECILPPAVNNPIVPAFAAGLHCTGHAVAFEQERVAEKFVAKFAEGEQETAEWSSVVFDLQRASIFR